MTERIFDKAFGVLYKDDEFVTKGLRFFAPMKANTLTEFRVLQVKYGIALNLNQIEMVCEDCNGQTNSFVFHYSTNEEGGYVTYNKDSISLYNSVDDFVVNKPMNLHAVQRKVRFYEPFESLMTTENAYYGTEQIDCSAYTIKDNGVAVDKFRIPTFEVYETKHNWLFAKIIEPTPYTYFATKNDAEMYLHRTIKVERFDDSKTNHSNVHKLITIDVCLDDDADTLLGKVIAAIN